MIGELMISGTKLTYLSEYLTKSSDTKVDFGRFSMPYNPMPSTMGIET